MNYYINPTAFSAVFTLPVSVVDNHFKFAKPEHIKVLLYVMRNMSNDPENSLIAKECGVSEYDVTEALLYWADSGILLPKTSAVPTKKEEKATVQKSQKPTRSDVAKRSDDPKVRYMLREAQSKLGRNLKSNESSTLLWLYDDNGLDISLILLIIQYAVAHDKANLRFIESTALSWVKKGICDIESADEEIRKMAVSEQAWGLVSKCFGIDKRKPSQKETDYAYLWVNDWEFSREMLERAYDECVNHNVKLSFPYVAKILEKWHEKGYKVPDDIEVKKPEKDGFASYDMDEFEKMLNSKD